MTLGTEILFNTDNNIYSPRTSNNQGYRSRHPGPDQRKQQDPRRWERRTGSRTKGISKHHFGNPRNPYYHRNIEL